MPTWTRNVRSQEKKVESEIKDIAGLTCTPLKQIYDGHVTIESNIQPFVKLQWAMGKRRKKITTHTNLCWKVQKFIERENRHYCTVL